MMHLGRSDMTAHIVGCGRPLCGGPINNPLWGSPMKPVTALDIETDPNTCVGCLRVWREEFAGLMPALHAARAAVDCQGMTDQELHTIYQESKAAIRTGDADPVLGLWYCWVGADANFELHCRGIRTYG